MVLTELSNQVAAVGPHMSPHQEKATRAAGSTSKEEESKVEVQDVVEPNLQDAFAQFRAKRAKQLAKQKAKKEAARKAMELRRRTDPKFQEQLRAEFVARARTYLGVPYSKSVAAKYCEAGDPDLDAEKYLDCCGVVRQVVRDLSDKFGFSVGPWNQSYQFETLCESQLSGVSEMQPGDLIFTAGTYYDKERKRQRHDMTHVEIFVGGKSGEGTIGSRKHAMVLAETGIWQGDPTRIGHVSEHPTFRFKSTGYTSDKYYFCSIKPWLEGDCRPRLTEWVGQCGISGQWIKESKAGRAVTGESRSVFTSDECDDGDAA